MCEKFKETISDEINDASSSYSLPSLVNTFSIKDKKRKLNNNKGGRKKQKYLNSSFKTQYAKQQQISKFIEGYISEEGYSLQSLVEYWLKNKKIDFKLALQNIKNKSLLNEFTLETINEYKDDLKPTPIYLLYIKDKCGISWIKEGKVNTWR